MNFLSVAAVFIIHIILPDSVTNQMNVASCERQCFCWFAAVLDHIREISRNAYAVAGRVQSFIDAMTDSIRHVGKALTS